MLEQIDDPLHFAERLVRCYGQLVAQQDQAMLFASAAQAVADLCACELVQLYQLDSTHTCLALQAEHHNGQQSPHPDSSVPSAYYTGGLLQFCLSQTQALSLRDIDPRLYDVAFLPATPTPWRSLFCQPLIDGQGTALGVLVCASTSARDLQAYGPALNQLGSFLLALRHRVPLQPLQPARQPFEAATRPHNYGLIGDSPVMCAVYQLIDRVLNNSTPVLITGETGTGKELVAQAIHREGFRQHKSFVVQNCASLPEHLLESELFGCVKGAYTGADRNRPGLFDAAHGGTLFLDEIGDMPLMLQAKLLRVLQEGEVRPLGSIQTHKVDVRIIAATHRNLADRVAEGLFREDLYYRLAHFPIRMPALRLRGQDIERLACHLSSLVCRELDRPDYPWARSALDLLGALPYPGNVRELKGMITRAVLLCETGVLQPEHFSVPAALGPDRNGMSLNDQVERFERSIINNALRNNGSHLGKTAETLQIPLRTLTYRINKLSVRGHG